MLRVCKTNNGNSRVCTRNFMQYLLNLYTSVNQSSQRSKVCIQRLCQRRPAESNNLLYPLGGPPRPHCPRLLQPLFSAYFLLSSKLDLLNPGNTKVGPVCLTSSESHGRDHNKSYYFCLIILVYLYLLVLRSDTGQSRLILERVRFVSSLYLRCLQRCQ